MCGIFGHTLGNHKLELKKSRHALDTLTHRGPDQWDDWYDERAYIGHRRLSIIDLSEAGQQPMISKNADGTSVVMTANGEIWNFSDLRKRLEQRFDFKSNSDSEVLLHGYTAWGIEELLEQIDGMFAFSILDGQESKLYLTRDRYGIKPLYYAPPCPETGGRFVYASEIKAIFDLCPELCAFSKRGIADWLLHRGSYTGLTPYHDIFKLLPGHYLKVDVKTGAHELKQYYELLDYTDGEPASTEELEALFSEAINRRLMSDVPVGLQLSGGVDSSLVAHGMANLVRGETINSFSIGFKDEDEKHLSEEPYATSVSEKLGLIHHQININKQDIRDNFEHVLWLADGMLDYPNTIPIYLLSKYSKPLVTVQLTGEGADELFGGYTKFQRMATLANQNPFFQAVPDFMISMTGSLKREAGRRLYLHKYYGGRRHDILDHLNAYIPRATVEALFNEQPEPLLDRVYAHNTRARQKFDALPFEKQLLLLDHKTYLHAVLERQDRASMGASIESRVPFLDRRMIEWAVRLPANDLFDKSGTKKILKQMAAETFDHDFAYRRKVGFPMPIRDWMTKDEGLGGFMQKTKDKDFILNDVMNMKALESKGFEHTLLNYSDPQSQWINWFMMVMRGAQDRFNITDVRA